MKFSEDRCTNSNLRPAISAPAALVLVIMIVILAYAAFTYFPASTTGGSRSGGSGGGTGTGNTNTAPNNLGSPCAATNAWTVSQIEKAYGSDTLAGTVAVNGFAVQNGQLVAAADLTGAASPTTSTGTYVPNGNNILEFTETSTVLTYPVYAPFTASGTVGSNGVTLASTGPNPTVTLQCAPSSSNANAWVWTVIATPIQAPTSGTSSTSNAKTLCINSNGNSLTAASTNFPTTTTLITCNLQILQTYRGAGYTIPIYGTQANPVTQYSTGQTYYGQAVNRYTVALVLANNTAVQAQLDPSAAAGITMQTVTGNTLASGTKAWIVSGFQGCSPAPGSAGSSSPFNCLTLPLDMYTNSHSGHLNACVEFVDMQDVAYLLNNLVTNAQGSFGTSGGATFGACTGFSSGLTPTSGNDAGSPAALIKQKYEIING